MLRFLLHADNYVQKFRFIKLTAFSIESELFMNSFVEICAAQSQVQTRYLSSSHIFSEQLFY